jgi:hypothetical protein
MSRNLDIRPQLVAFAVTALVIVVMLLSVGPAA